MRRSNRSTSDLVWAEEEKDQHLQDLLGSRHLLIPDDIFYTPFVSKEDLLETAQKLLKHLKIHSEKLRFSFSHTTPQSGACEIDKKSARISIPVRYMGRPYEGTGVLAHLLCHYLLVRKGMQLSEESENEKLVDDASIAAGLGIVILNGLPGSSWQYMVGSKLRTATEHRPEFSALGYHTPASYGRALRRYLDGHHIDEHQAGASLLPWALPLVYPRSSPIRSRPKFVDHAEKYKNRSVRRFWTSVTIVAGLLVFAGYVVMQRPAVLSEELRQQQQKVASLESSYNGCSERVAHKEAGYQAADQATQRFIDGERTECKSLENRYNYEVGVYNDLLKRYDTSR